jgi:hypothetical protein
VRLRETAPGVARLDHDSGEHDDQAVAIAIAVAVLQGKASGQGHAFLEAWRKEIAAGPNQPPTAAKETQPENCCDNPQWIKRTAFRWTCRNCDAERRTDS